MRKFIIGLCSVGLMFSLMACGQKGNAPVASVAEISSQTQTVAETGNELVLPIEGLTWGMSKEDCLSHLAQGAQETVAENGDINITVNQNVLGSNAAVVLTFRQKAADDYFTNLPQQYLIGMEFKYILRDYDAVTQQLIQKYGAEWRPAETEEGKTACFGSYKVENIQNETIKKLAVGYVETFLDSGKYAEKYRTAPETVWDEMSEEDRADSENIVLDYISLEMPTGSDYFYLKALGEWMLPIANSKIIVN